MIDYFYIIDYDPSLVLILSILFAEVSIRIDTKFFRYFNITNENSTATIVLQKCGQSQSEIVILLKPLGINRLFVFRTMKLYNKMGDIFDRPREEYPRSVHLPNGIQAV